MIILSFVLCNSCVDEYWPELDKYENLLVIDGYISNEPGPYTIKLSLSSKVEEIKIIPVSNAMVTIMNDQGVSEVLTESEAGTYVTSINGIQGQIGRKYKIAIITADGKSYSSEFEKLLQPTEIESINAQLEYREQENIAHNLAGYQFYLNTFQAISDTNYYLTKLEATYKYKADFLIRYIFDGTLRPFENSDSLQTCWKTYNVPQIYTYSTLNLTEPVIRNYPLLYVDTETDKLYIRYSLLVQQFSLSESAYQFWSQVKENSYDQGGLYNTQPYQVRGNISNTNDPEEPVLGYFMSAGISKKRIFVYPPPVLFYFGHCELTDWDFENMGTIYLTGPDEWPVYATTDNIGRRAFPVQACINCELNGGTIVKPDFWED